MSDIHIGKGDVKIKTQGIAKTNKALRKAGKDATELSELMHAIGQMIIDRAEVPVRSGRLKNTLRAGKGKTKAVVRAGRAAVPYAGVVHYGWPSHDIKENPFLTESVERNSGEAAKMLAKGLRDIIKRNDL